MVQPNKQNRRRPIKAAASLPVVKADAAGIDIGATEIYVCVPSDSCPEPIGRFGPFTSDLLELAAWLKQCGVRTVAMESTGVYWIPLFQVLEDQGFEVTLVNPHYAKKPHKSDVEDCQWLQYLHAVGLLTNSFRPKQQVCAVRTILRHRANHVKAAVSHIQRMQKSLTQMNLLLHNVISDISGTTGLAIIDAILAGERDPRVLAQHRDPRIKKSSEEIAKSLVGDYRPEHLFTLKQSLEALRFLQAQMADCDTQIDRMLIDFDSQIDAKEHGLPNGTTRSPKSQKNGISLPNSDLRQEMYRINGVDLTQVPGLGTSTVYGLLCEIGTDLSGFESAGHFASWLGLCPDHRVSGGKVLSRKTRKVKSRAAIMLRTAAQSLSNSHSYLGDFYRRMRARFGPAAANTAAAHKLARIVFHLLTTKQSYQETVFNDIAERFKRKRIHRLQKEAQALGYNFQPA